MEQLSAPHLAAIAAIALSALPAVGLARRLGERRAVLAGRGLAAVLLLDVVAYHVVVVARGSWNLDFDLPLHLSDAVSLVAVAALWTGRRTLVELTWFWGLSGNLQAILTPDLAQDFPSFFYWNYFVAHGGVLVAAAFLVPGRGLVPAPGAVWRAMLATAALAALAGLANLLTGGNYLFLRERPGEPSLLDLMGPWPWYIFSGALLALVLFALLYAPFARRGSGRDPAAT